MQRSLLVFSGTSAGERVSLPPDEDPSRAPAKHGVVTNRLQIDAVSPRVRSQLLCSHTLIRDRVHVDPPSTRAAVLLDQQPSGSWIVGSAAPEQITCRIGYVL